MLFQFILTIKDKIENFYREKPLHFNTVFQTHTSTNSYQGVNCCMQDTFAHATHSAARPSALATIGYLAYNARRKGILHTKVILDLKQYLQL